MAFCHDCVENFEGNKCPKCGKVIVSGNTKIIGVCLSLFIAFICVYFFIDAVSSGSSDVANSIKQKDNSDKYEVVEAASVKQDMFSLYIQGEPCATKQTKRTVMRK
ncbi:MAG: hypothetical protein FWF51_03195 [Chitinivibrionia bacterium]|nr:hypothetical protein [Chitinivibrionia bacterium]MCL1946145.1 hypothetical protein [Chitinivibrionia bacterium]